ncbi:hypothetical protein BDW02DRAFT_636194 [Decorospora gaudefroyi]|uniref:Heterokaryon incompatibility domain-containing protein n=1 Tax=Decorospora gaudefroyi TaxID=184978 RepID=A0A6A5KUZ2_9PLEO|nr:hypothetical protein BDW02DRAFT_636194 [Decorospora gaudefroyi]
MRLLYTASDGTLKWTKDIIRSEEIPPYAILSHTWGEQEVVFDDLKDIRTAQSKEGYRKIRFCAQQAKLDAINSMFRWYRDAERCYALLSDVENDSLEVLAPHSVEFFSKDGARLGDKESLKHTIHEVTGIPIEALLGSDLSKFDVAKRFSYAANRQTTEEEDGAYCLFGIFSVHLPLIYGEGKENALERLRTAAILKKKGYSHDQKERLDKICS